MTVLPLAPFSAKRTSSASPQLRAKNLMVEADKSGGDLFEIRPRPGLAPESAIAGTGVARGLFAPSSTSEVWAVVGSGVYVNGTLLTTVVTGTSPVSITGNSIATVIVSGGVPYFGTSSSFNQVSDPDLPASIVDAAVINSRVLFGELNSNRFWYSNVTQAGEIAGDAFVSAQASPDNVRGVSVLRDQIYVFGDDTIELWRNTTDPEFPFLKTPGGVINKGLLGTHLKCQAEESLWFVSGGREARVYELRGLQTRAVSPAWVDDYLKQTGIKSMWAVSWLDQTHILIDIRDVVTLVYSPTADVWTEWASGSASNLDARFAVGSGGDVLALRDGNGGIVRYQSDLVTDAGTPTEYLTAAFLPHSGPPEPIFSGELRGRGSNQTVSLRVSDDAGQTYTECPNAVLTAKQAFWRKLGRVEGRGKLLQFGWTGQFGALQSLALNKAD